MKTLFLFLAALGLAQPLAGAPPIELPAGALAFLEVNDLAGQVTRVRQSLLSKLITQSPEYRQALEAPQARQLLAGMQFAENLLGTNLVKVSDAMLGGQMVLALYPREGRKEPDAVLALRVGDAAVWQQLRGRLQPLLVLAGAKLKRTAEPGGVDRLQLEDKVFGLLRPDGLLVASRKDLLDSAEVLFAGKQAPALSASSAFAKFGEQMGRRHFMRLGVDLEAMQKRFGARLGVPAQFDNGGASLLFQALAELALKSPYLGLTLDLDDRGFDFAAGIAGGPKQVAPEFRWYFSDPASRGAPPLPEVPGLIGGLSWYVDFAGWYRQHEKLLTERAQPEFDKFESGIKTLLPGREFAEDVLPALGRSVTLVAAHQQFKHLGGGLPAVKLPGFALVFDLAKPAEGGDLFALLFQTIATLTNFGAAETGKEPWVMVAEEFEGTTLSRMRHLRAPKGAALPIVYNFMPCGAQVGSHFIFASAPDLCKGLMTALKKPAPKSANRNLLIQLRPGQLATLARNNGDILKAQFVQKGQDTATAQRGIDTLLQLLQAVESLEHYSTVGEDRFQFRLEGRWK